MPPIRAITRQEYADELREEASAEDEFGELAWGRALALFGLVPADQTLEESSITRSVEVVAAYYRSDTQDVTIIRDNTMGIDDASLTLAHEFVHALQDQRGELSALYEAHADSTDSRAALKCLTEGEAVVISNLTMPEITSVEPNQIRWHAYFGSWRDRVLDDVASAAAPLLSANSLVYPVGGLGVVRAYLGGRLGEIAELYETPPITFLSWAEPSARRFVPDELCEPPEAPDGFELRFHDQQGMLGLLSLYAALGLGARYEAAQAWAGDSFAVYTPVEEDSDDVAVVWRIRFRDGAAAEAFVDVSSAEEPAFTAQQAGAEVLLVASTTPDLLDGWSPEACSSGEEKSRHATARHMAVPRSVTRWLEHGRAGATLPRAPATQVQSAEAR